VNQQGRSEVIDSYGGASDLPIPLLFRQLDIAYPGSKFLLTIRNEINWLLAAKGHFSSKYNKWRDSWDECPFINQLHQMLYGTASFDVEIFLARYRRHNAEVMEYFKDRSSDLLVMDMDAGAGWPALCDFLGCAIPSDTPYPFANST